jgi:predicted phage terminase large subunit-like protein
MRFIAHEKLADYYLQARPLTLRIYGASDYATMEPKKGKKEPDFTEHGVFGLDAHSELWALDWWYRQCETDKSIAAFITLVRKWKPTKWFNEGGIIDKAIGPSIRSAMRDTRTYVAIDELPSLQDKGVKLQAFHAMASANVVHFPICAWAERVIEQLIKFPAGRWDDAADVCGLIGRAVDQMFNAQLPIRQTKSILVPFTEAWLMANDQPDKPKVRYF